MVDIDDDDEQKDRYDAFWGRERSGATEMEVRSLGINERKKEKMQACQNADCAWVYSHLLPLKEVKEEKKKKRQPISPTNVGKFFMTPCHHCIIKRPKADHKIATVIYSAIVAIRFYFNFNFATVYIDAKLPLAHIQSTLTLIQNGTVSDVAIYALYYS